MQHKTNKVLSILLALVMVLGLAPAMSVPAQAAENDGGKAIVLGTGVLDGPTEVTDDEDPNKKHYTPNSYVWFGVNGDGEDKSPIQWRVLDAAKANDKTTAGMFLLSEYLLNSGVQFNSSASDDNAYQGSGTPFVDGACKVSGNFYLIYGHNMKNKTMFSMLPNYADPGWYEEHAVIRFDTLYERREYEVMAVFYADATESGSENRFRYYEYTDLSEQSVFEEYVAQVNAAALYDTGVTVVYGDELITLSTCSYHTSDGRFVVVAKRIN